MLVLAFGLVAASLTTDLVGRAPTGPPAPQPPATAASDYGMPEADGPVLHVSPDGDDAGSGEADTPLRTITAAAARATPGTTVRVRAGRYNGDIATDVAGTPDARIAFVAQSPQVEIVGIGSAIGAWENNGDYINIVGFSITGPNEDGIYNRGSHVRIMNNRAYGFPTGNCIATGNTDYDLTHIDIIGNVVHGCGNNEFQDHCIYVGHEGGTIANNIAYGRPRVRHPLLAGLRPARDHQQSGVRQRQGGHRCRRGARGRGRR